MNSQKKSPKKDRLTPSEIEVNADYLSDKMIVTCMNIEDAMIAIGAQPGIDYNRKDLMSWALEVITSPIKGLKTQWQEPLPDRYKK